MELTVCRDAMLRGADVFKNVSCVGKVDLIIAKDGEAIRIDVKTPKFCKRRKTWTSNSCKPISGIYHVLINPDTWKPRWNCKHIPIGWEEFWN